MSGASGAGSLLSGFTSGFDTGRSVIDRRKQMELDQADIESRRNRPRARPDPDAPMRPVARGEVASSGEAGGDRDAFISSMMPHAIEVGQRTGLDPRLIIAQSAQETGWGQSAPGNNFFGIKSHGQAGGNNLSTNEVIDGQTVTVNDNFRAYDDMAASVRGYGDFLTSNPRYSDMLAARDLDGQLDALRSSGYATDPNYADSVGSIARSIQMAQAPASTGVERSVRPQKRPGQEILARFYSK